MNRGTSHLHRLFIHLMKIYETDKANTRGTNTEIEREREPHASGFCWIVYATLYHLIVEFFQIWSHLFCLLYNNRYSLNKPLSMQWWGLCFSLAHIACFYIYSLLCLFSRSPHLSLCRSRHWRFFICTPFLRFFWLPCLVLSLIKNAFGLAWWMPGQK